MGYLGFHDEESFDLEMRYQDMAEITEELQHWLLYVDEPGISNANRARLRQLEDPRRGSEPGRRPTSGCTPRRGSTSPG
jgi:hypothetical protein